MWSPPMVLLWGRLLLQLTPPQLAGAHSREPGPAHPPSLTFVAEEFGEQRAGSGDGGRGVVGQSAEHVHDELNLLPFLGAHPLGAGHQVQISGQVHVT